MSAVLIILFVLLALYAATLLTLGVSFKQMAYFKPGSAPQIPVSIIICARNEQPHLAKCLRNLIEQNYPRDLMQVIVVNDASTDSTVLIADTELEHAGIEYRILSNPSRQGKKRSISAAIRFARHQLIVLRDADTYAASTSWLSQVASIFSLKPGLIIGAVAIRNEPSVLAALQNLESQVLSVVTGGSAHMGKPFLCSGANLAFPREVFRRTGGFESHSHLLSGDDVFFMEDVKRLGDVPVSFLKSKESLVFTYPLASVKAVLMQRARWAAKFKFNPNPMNLWLAFLVFAVNLFTIFSLVGAFLKPGYTLVCLLFVCLKVGTDLLLLSLASSLSAERPAAGRTALAAVVYPFYASAVALLSIFIRPVWKEE